MARVELLDDRFVIHNSGMRRLLTIVGTITVRYEAVESVEVGLDEVPPWLTRRIGFNPGLGRDAPESSGGGARSGSWT